MPRVSRKASGLARFAPERLVDFGANFPKSPRSAERKRLALRLLRRGANLSRSDALIPTPKQIKSLRSNRARMEKQEHDFFSKNRALAFAEKMGEGPRSIPGNDYFRQVRLIRALFDGDKAILKLAGRLSVAGDKRGSRKIHAVLGGKEAALEFVNMVRYEHGYPAAERASIILGFKEANLKLAGALSKLGRMVGGSPDSSLQFNRGEARILHAVLSGKASTLKLIDRINKSKNIDWKVSMDADRVRTLAILVHFAKTPIQKRLVLSMLL